MLTEEGIRGLPAGNRLDALVHEVVLGLSPVLGEAFCWAPDGCWSVAASKDEPNDGGYSLRPVYQSFYPDEDQEENRGRYGKTEGVCNLWLHPVAHYSTDPGDAWDALRHLLTENVDYSIRGFVSDHVVELFRGCGPELDYNKVWGVWASAHTMPLAVCRAALLAKGKS